MTSLPCLSSFFFFNDTATTEIYTLSLHDALPISPLPDARRDNSRITDFTTHRNSQSFSAVFLLRNSENYDGDRKSTRLNSSHSQISYAVFCLKKKKKTESMTYIICQL